MSDRWIAGAELDRVLREDRAIMCADSDEPIHSASKLSARPAQPLRFLFFSAKLSAEPADQDIPCPDKISDERDDSSASAPKS